MAISLLELFGNLNLLKLEFTAEVADSATLPKNLGSALRGVLGWQLQRLTCPFDRQHCTECPICEHCPYHLLFEKKSDMPGLADSPRGYIITPEPYMNTGKINFYLSLLGDCCRTAPAIVKAFVKGGESGIGHKRNAYKIIGVREIRPEEVPVSLGIAKNGCVDIMRPYSLRQWISAGDPDYLKTDYTAVLVNPVRLRKNGKYLSRMDWPFFFASLARRLEGLNCLFNNGNLLGRQVWKELTDEFNNINIKKEELSWQDLRRYSNRQGRKVPLGGLTGRVVIKNSSDDHFQWWLAASLVHVGKGAVMGLGKIRLISAIH